MHRGRKVFGNNEVMGVAIWLKLGNISHFHHRYSSGIFFPADDYNNLLQQLNGISWRNDTDTLNVSDRGQFSFQHLGFEGRFGMLYTQYLQNGGVIPFGYKIRPLEIQVEDHNALYMNWMKYIGFSLEMHGTLLIGKSANENRIRGLKSIRLYVLAGKDGLVHAIKSGRLK